MHAGLIKGCVKQDAAMAVWLAHTGRKSECEGLIVPSVLKLSESYKTPIQMSIEDIVSVKQAFVSAAVRAQRRIRHDRDPRRVRLSH